MPTQPLNAALLLDSPQVPAWAYEAIRRVAVEGHARWSVVMFNADGGVPTRLLLKLWQNRHTAVASTYVWLDKLVSPADRDPLAPCDTRSILAGVRQLERSDANVAEIETLALDLIVNFGTHAPSEKLVAAAKLGVWSIKYGVSSDASRPELAGLLEVIENQDVNRSTLEMLIDKDRSVVLAETCTAVDRLSAARNRSNMFWPAASLLPRQLARLHQLGAEQLCVDVEANNKAGSLNNSQFSAALNNRKLLPSIARQGVRRLKRKWTKQFYRDQWFMLSHFDETAGAASRTAPEGQVDATLAVPGSARLAEPTNFQAIIPPIDRFWADPHVVCRGGKHYVFFEEYLYAARKAHISVMEFDDHGRWQPPRPVLERPYHLSYPFIFDWQGELFMLPETSGNRTLEVYRCDEFPHRWSLHKVLWRNVNAYDATLLEQAGHWWMFVTMVENAGASFDELFLFHADHPLSDHWLPHPCNPIVSDVRRARPAGPIFTQHGKLYRPAQDSSRTYGYGMRVNRIDELSPKKYSETEVGRIEPLAHDGWLATHTLSSDGGLTMIDAQRRRLKFGHTAWSNSSPFETTEALKRGEELKTNG